MPRDMFGDIVARKPAVRARRSPVLVASIAAHGIALLAVLVASAVAPDILPTPREALAFYELRAVDIALPPPPAPPRPVVNTPPAGPTVSPNAAPLVAPTGISAETGIETIESVDVAAGVARIEGAGGSLETFGGFETPPPPPVPKDPVRLHRGITAPQKIVDVLPAYPELARRAHVEGVVILETVIDAAGSVSSARVLRSIQLLDQAALDAVRKWRFSPALLNGEPIPVVMTVTVRFTLER